MLRNNFLMEVLFFPVFIQNDLRDIHSVVGNTFQITQQFKEMDPRVYITFCIRQAIDMTCAQLFLQRVNFVLQHTVFFA